MGIGDLFLIFVMTGLSMLLALSIRRSRDLQRQNAFLDSISHELKTPIASLQLQVDTLSRRNLPEEKRGAFLQRMREDIIRLHNQLDLVLQASQLEHNQKPSRHEPVSWLPTLEKARDLVCRRHNIKSEQITIDCPQNAMLHSDATALETIIFNVMDNACKYCANAVQVHARVHSVGKRWHCTISDNGIGVEPGQNSYLSPLPTRRPP